MRSRSILSCSRRCPISSAGRSQAPLLSYLAPLYAVDSDSFEFLLPAGRGDTHILPSIVGDVYAVAAHHLVSFGYLLLDEAPTVGKGTRSLGDRSLQAFAAGLLAGEHAVADEVRSHHLFDGVQVRLGACLEETPD